MLRISKWRHRRDRQPQHRLSDGDVVPVPGYRRCAAILNGPTWELPVVDVNDPLRMTPGQEHRSGVRRWLP